MNRLCRVCENDSDYFDYADESDYVFDNIGNRLSTTNNSETTEYIANSLNQYTTVTDDSITNSPTYDADGNMLTNGDWTYTWNGENRLVMASNSSHVITYAYDYMGRCYEKVKDGNAVDYIWDDYNIISETSDSQTNYNIWGLDLSGSMQGAGGVGGLLTVVQDGETYFAGFDANGNVTSYADTNGAIVAGRVYSAFGKTLSLTGAKKDDYSHWFSTKPWDADTGMSEYEYRKYLPELGRWASRDPIVEDLVFGGALGEDEYANLYAFIGNDSQNLWDVLGESAEGSSSGSGAGCPMTSCYSACNRKWSSLRRRKGCRMACDRAAKKFEDWFNENKSLDWTSGLTDCPCTSECVDSSVWQEMATGEGLHGYHVGAEGCMRSNPVDGKANQCCYKDGKLITHGSGMGSSDRGAAPDVKNPLTYPRFPAHKFKDMIPADVAKYLDGDDWGCWSEKYIEARPQVGADKCPKNP